MATRQQLGGMRGLYLVAAELSKRGFIVSPTSRSAQGADLLVTDPDCSRAFSVQVKSNSQTYSFWLMGEKNQRMRSRSFIYIFVNLRKDGVEYFVVPSAVVADNIKVSQSSKKRTEPTDTVGAALAKATSEKVHTWYEFRYDTAKPYQDNWKMFDDDIA